MHGRTVFVKLQLSERPHDFKLVIKLAVCHLLILMTNQTFPPIEEASFNEQSLSLLSLIGNYYWRQNQYDRKYFDNSTGFDKILRFFCHIPQTRVWSGGPKNFLWGHFLLKKRYWIATSFFLQLLNN